MIHPMGGLFLGDTIRRKVLIALRKGMLFGFPSRVLDFLHENYANKSNPHPTQSPWISLTVPSERTRKTKLWKAIYYILFILHVCVLRRWYICAMANVCISKKNWGAGIDSFYPVGSGESNSACHVWQQTFLPSEMFYWPTSKNFKDPVLKTIVSIWSNRNVH